MFQEGERVKPTSLELYGSKIHSAGYDDDDLKFSLLLLLMNLLELHNSEMCVCMFRVKVIYLRLCIR